MTPCRVLFKNPSIDYAQQASTRACMFLDEKGRQHPSTSGSGQHQTQHGNNTALLPSNCYHSPSVLLLRYCSADQPLRAVYSGFIPDTHTRSSARARSHAHVTTHVYNLPCTFLFFYKLLWIGETTVAVFLCFYIKCRMCPCPHSLHCPHRLPGQRHRYNRCWREGGDISLQPILHVWSHTGGRPSPREEQKTLLKSPGAKFKRW